MKESVDKENERKRVKNIVVPVMKEIK